MAFVLTVTIPLTWTAFAAAFAANPVPSPDPEIVALVATGVFVGSQLWWTALSAGSSWLGGRVHARLGLINYLADCATMVTGMIVLAAALARAKGL